MKSVGKLVTKFAPCIIFILPWHSQAQPWLDELMTWFPWPITSRIDSQAQPQLDELMPDEIVHYSEFYEALVNDRDFKLVFKDRVNSSLANALPSDSGLVLDESYTHLSVSGSDYWWTVGTGAGLGAAGALGLNTLLWAGGNTGARMYLGGRVAGFSLKKTFFGGATVGAAGSGIGTYAWGLDCSAAEGSFDVSGCTRVRTPIFRVEVQYKGDKEGVERSGSCMLYYAFPEIEDRGDGTYEYTAIYEIDECSHLDFNHIITDIPDWFTGGIELAGDLWNGRECEGQRGFNDLRIGEEVNWYDKLLWQECIVAKGVFSGIFGEEIPESTELDLEPLAQENAEPEPSALDNIEPDPVSQVNAEPEPVAQENAEPEPSALDNIEPEPVAQINAEPEPVAQINAEPEPAAPDNREPRMILPKGGIPAPH